MGRERKRKERKHLGKNKILNDCFSLKPIIFQFVVMKKAHHAVTNLMDSAIR